MAHATALAVALGLALPGEAVADVADRAATPGLLAQAAPPSATNNPLHVRVTAGCEQGETVFQVLNEGDAWPQPGKISIYRTNGQVLVSQRNMRMAKGQRASFRVKSAGGDAEVGLAVEPTWYARPFEYDAKITCN